MTRDDLKNKESRTGGATLDALSILKPMTKA